MTQQVLAVAALTVALVGWQVSHQAQADPVEFDLEQEFPLSGGQEATIAGENLRLRFTDVLEDSRCPTEVGRRCWFAADRRARRLCHT